MSAALTTLEVECPACEGHGIVTDEGGLYGVADRRFAKWIDCADCNGAGVVEEEDFEAEIFEMTPRQFAGVATFGLASLASSMLFGLALLHVWRAM